MEQLSVHSSIVASPDPDATELVCAAATHLREDLRRNAPEVARGVDGSWDGLAARTVSVAPDLICRVELSGTPVEVFVDAGVDWASSTLYVRDLSAVNRPSAGGASMATGTAPKKSPAGLTQPRTGSAVPQPRTAARPYTAVEQEKCATSRQFL
ncbi:hypothetical protein [Streptomyces buecherae]|uniref:hypothetical protein n=1 Tax=Streptomyces buecherae TaxID=2763006 RepID=UPI0036A173AB